ncbi:hypothetical protein F901_01799 [Acinetobacter dispersus]|uniref:MFS transporter n=1 Tax=Acinetobacter dispersus TaxID=70348 RepID=UPI0002D135F1|nr:MFS transporter [Acinetobacter dispersus]ENX54491.1 hypothetical protein F901_01799 [Acinetobacter dispersus]
MDIVKIDLSTRQKNHRWKVLGIGVAANASFSAAFQGIPTTAVFMRSDYHFSTQTIGLIFGLMGLGIAISELPWGILTDKWGDRKVLLIGLISTAIILWLLCLFFTPTNTYIPDAYWLATGCILVGLLGGSVNGSSGKAVMRWFDDSERGLAMSIRQTAVPLGGGAGALILPFFAKYYGFISVFGVLALFCCITAFFTWLWLSENPSTEYVKKTIQIKTSDINPLMDKNIWYLVIAIGVLCAPQFAILTFTSVFFHDFAHFDLWITTVTLLIIQLGAIAFRVWSGHWTDKRKNRKEYLKTCSMLSTVLFFILTIFVFFLDQEKEITDYQTFLFVSLFIVTGIVVSAWHGVAYTELAVATGLNKAATALGMANTTAFLTLFLVPISIPFIVSHFNWSTIWFISGICSLIAFAFFPKVSKS